jgi:hypothetical protein
VPLREKTLWRMLYKTATHASEVLALNIEDLDLDARRAPIRSRAATPDGSTGALRTCCPASSAAAKPDRRFSPNAAPAPPGAPQPRTCALPPDGPGSATTAPGSCSPGTPGGNCTSYATPQPPTSPNKASPLQLIMAKTRHRNPRTAMRYVRPGAEAVAEITALLEPPRRQG